ncbi:hypothetical protein WKI67_00060 [Streptomyces sp. MS2.AVA.5]|uniref:Uncharacterized protein n=1 Tax=Streptomyces achmelvichensis TaxID=3134111 RepID=A0ACC6PLT7_9ACTN
MLQVAFCLLVGAVVGQAEGFVGDAGRLGEGLILVIVRADLFRWVFWLRREGLLREFPYTGSCLRRRTHVVEGLGEKGERVPESELHVEGVGRRQWTSVRGQHLLDVLTGHVHHSLRLRRSGLRHE